MDLVFHITLAWYIDPTFLKVYNPVPAENVVTVN